MALEREMSDISTKSLGVVIPTYNRVDALMECLACLEAQTFKHFEVVVVDDGSTDTTSEQMRAYVAKSPLDIRYVSQQNSGPAKARNVGISMLNSPVCIMIGDDIFASPTLVETHLKFHREHPELAAAALGWTQWNTTGQTITPFMRWLGESPYQFAYKELLAGSNPIWHHFYTSNISVKTELMKTFRFREDFPFAAMEDAELAYRINVLYGLKLQFIPTALAFHLHPTTFRQLCERMARVGYSCRLFHELWPDSREPSPTLLRRVFDPMLRRVSRSPLLTALLVGAADFSTRYSCPNRLMEAALVCKYEFGYASRRNNRGQLVLP
jgi:glycosyltransferase involved in cell wall biosynthesis